PAFTVDAFGQLAVFNNQSLVNGQAADSNAQYLWNFGDSMSVSALRDPLFAYNWSGPFLVSLEMTHPNGGNPCTETYYHVFNAANSPLNHVFGYVTAGGNPATDIAAYLIRYDSGSQTLTALDTLSTTNDNRYHFSYPLVSNSAIFVKAALEPTDPVYASFLPTYFDGEALWYDADPIIPFTYYQQKDIHLIGGLNPGGPAFVSGFVSQGANKNEGDPIPGLTVLALDQNAQPVGFVRTAADGSYIIDDLPYGNYRIMVEYYGKSLAYYDVSLDALNPSAENLDFAVEEAAVVALNTSQESDLNPDQVWAFTDAAQRSIFIGFELQEQTTVEVRLLSIDGRQQLAERTTFRSGSGQVKLPHSGLAAGLYILQVQNQRGHQFIQKILIR
ncbi:MAG: carboxypeptidase regulatory-like domain-containing protein, partial [Bacteroidota bacterium]